ncbi:MAG: hypothetical protein V3569_00305 [Acholeplasmataceae bacterium]
MKYKYNSKIKEAVFKVVVTQKNKALTKKDTYLELTIPYRVYKSHHYYVHFSLNRQKVKSAKEKKTYVMTIDLPLMGSQTSTYLRVFKALQFHKVSQSEIRAVNYIERTTKTETTYWSDGDKSEYTNTYDTPKTDYVSYLSGWTLYRIFDSLEAFQSFESSFIATFEQCYLSKTKSALWHRPIFFIYTSMFTFMRRSALYLINGIVGFANIYLLYRIIFVWLILQSHAQLTPFEYIVLASILAIDLLYFFGSYLIIKKRTILYRHTDNIKQNIYDYPKIPSKIFINLDV